MSWHDTPIYITNRNNLDRGLSTLVQWLLDRGMTSITILDNGSTLVPLLTYYSGLEPASQVTVRYLNDNLGPYAFWSLGLHTQQKTRFIVTDPDVVPSDDCPHDLILKLHALIDRHMAVKVGPSLRIDNLPDHYVHKQAVIAWEAQFWSTPVPDESAWHAQIDTTFALYQPHSPAWPIGPYIRLDTPYSFEHVPWYEDSARAQAERDFYLANARLDWTHWSRQ